MEVTPLSRVIKAANVPVPALRPWTGFTPLGAEAAAPALARLVPMPAATVPADAAGNPPEPAPEPAAADQQRLAAIAAELAAARAEAERLRQAAWEEGYAAGQAAAAAEQSAAHVAAATLHEVAMAERENLLRELAARGERYMAAARQDLLNLAVTLARRIVVAELSLRPDVLGEMVAEALRQLRPGVEARVHVHPHDLPRLPGAGHDPSWHHAAPGGAQVQPDPTLEPGEFLIRTAQGEIDGRLSSQFSEMTAFIHQLEGNEA